MIMWFKLFCNEGFSVIYSKSSLLFFCFIYLFIYFETGEGFWKIQILSLPTQGVRVMEERTMTSSETLNQT